MASNAPDPPGAQQNPFPPDELSSPSKSQEVRPAVMTAFTQDFHTQSTVKYTQTDASQTTNYEELAAYHTTAPVSSFSSSTEARDDHTRGPSKTTQNTEDCTPPGGILSPNTAAAMVATPSYGESTRPPTQKDTQGLNLEEKEASTLDDFITHIRFKPLPPDVADRGITMNTSELQELQYITNNLKQELNNAYMGYSYYYTNNDVRMHPDKNVDLPEEDVNAAQKLLIVALDAGFGAPRTTMPYKILNSTSWFRLVFSVLGAILRGAIRSDQFRKFGRDSLNGVSDHVIIQEGLPRPNRFGQLLSAMANQLATLADPEAHYPGDHHTRLYEEATQIVSDKIQAALLAKAKREITEEDELAARNVAWAEMIYDAKEELQSNPEQRARVEAEVAKQIVSALHTESQLTIDEWRTAWLEGLRAAILEEPFQRQASSPPQSQLLRENEAEARVAIADRLQEVKKEFLSDLKQKIASEQDQRIIAEAKGKYDELVTEQVSSLERSLTAQHEQRLTEAKNRANADIARELEPWKAFEIERLKGLFSATAVHETIDNDAALLRTAAKKLGFDIVEGSQPTKKQRTAPDAGHKRSRSGSRARRTPSPSTRSQDDMDVTPTKPDRPERGRPVKVPALGLTDSLKVAKLQQTADEVQRKKLAANQTTKASMHNPANQMTDDAEMQVRARGGILVSPPVEAARTTIATPAPPTKEDPVEDPVMKAVLAGINNLTSQISSVTSRLINLEHRFEEVQKPSDPRLRTLAAQETQITRKTAPPPVPDVATCPPTKGPSMTAKPQSTTAPLAAVPQALSESLWPSLGGGTSNRPQPDPIVAPTPWIKVARAAAYQTQEETQTFARNAAAVQGRTPSGRRKAGHAAPYSTTALTTRVTVTRNGGLADQDAEDTLRNMKPEHIVMAARTAAEALSTEAIQILGGHWAGSVAKTGNFVFTINGKIPFAQIQPFAEALVSPLKVGKLVPLDGWLWTQFRGVPTAGPDGVVYDSNALTAELLRNPAFYGVTLCMLAHWQKSIDKVMHDAEATLQVSYLDETGEVTKTIQHSDVHMFGRKVKFFVIGNNPRLAQCSKCHEIGHEAKSPTCKLPANALRCHLCGGTHHSSEHDFFCRGVHKIAGKCDCKFKCLLCKGNGHHARSRNCPKRGNFAPPPLPKHEGTPPQRQTAPPAPTSALPPPRTESLTPKASTIIPEDLVTTQREPGVESPPNPTSPAPKKGRKKRPSKGKGKRRSSPPRDDNSFSILDTLTPSTARVDEAYEIPPYPYPSSSKGWGNPGEDDDEDELATFDPSQDNGDIQLHSAPALRVVEATMLLSADALWTHYERTAPDEEQPLCQWHEEIELGWGGLSRARGMSTREAVGLRARYAAQMMMPTTKPEVIATLCKSLHPSKQAAALEETDKEWGGNGSGAHLTALNYFIRNTPDNLLLVHNSLPLTAGRAMTALKGADDYDLRLMTEEYDLQMGGTGSGTHFFHSLPHNILDANLDTQARIMTMQTPPSLRHPLGKAASEAAEHARQLVANGTRIGPPLSHGAAARFIHNYCVDADLPLNTITPDIVYDIAATHTPDVPRSAGLPAFRSLQKHIRKTCHDAVLDLPPTPSHG